MRKLIISIDQAVHPNNIIAASTRVVEMLGLQTGKAREKDFLTVKFGEILSNHNSIVYTWQKQIFAGDFLTVFHPENRRYLMTFSEAVQLVLQAVVLGYSREVFILDMGETVKILDLAQRFIQMSRYRVSQDIKVILTDLYFGDKLYNKWLILGEEDDKIVNGYFVYCTNN
ncbi:MAG TPA: polysaccharide biosynthesis protein [Nostocaceae cyanobacterium]|nr:polysaccharide biosynthesis protein [Nostocaceae cyanobacterium]